MKIDVLTLFPEMFNGPFDESMIKRAQEENKVEINIHNLRDWAEDKHKSVDDRPFGGGPGMILRVDVIDKALSDLRKKNTKVLLMSAKGETYDQQKAQLLSNVDHIIIICGHYEDVDARISEHLVDEEISIGDFVLTGGEIAAMAIVDSVVRLIPGVLGHDEGTVHESHSEPGYIEYPQYTRPEEYKGWKVPEVLLSGNHKEIEKWRDKNSGKK